MDRLGLDERRQGARRNVARARRYVQEHLKTAAVLKRDGRESGSTLKRLQIFRALLELHERELERIETALLDADDMAPEAPSWRA